MHVLCLSTEPDLLGKVRIAFSDRIVEIDCRSNLPDFLAAASGLWDIFVVDFDEVGNEYSSPLELARKLGPQARILFIGSAKLSEQRRQIESDGHVLLVKPLAIGEIGLALHKLFAKKP